MLEENKAVELKDDELEKVTGGITQNPDGTYNLQGGETFCFSSKKVQVICNMV